MWYSTFLGRKESDGLLAQSYADAWIAQPFLGAALDDDQATWCGCGEPYPHP